MAPVTNTAQARIKVYSGVEWEPRPEPIVAEDSLRETGKAKRGSSEGRAAKRVREGRAGRNIRES